MHIHIYLHIHVNIKACTYIYVCINKCNEDKVLHFAFSINTKRGYPYKCKKKILYNKTRKCVVVAVIAAVYIYYTLFCIVEKCFLCHIMSFDIFLIENLTTFIEDNQAFMDVNGADEPGQSEELYLKQLH